MGDEWDERWSRIREMESGSHDPLPEFAEEVVGAMEDTGNGVGRPCVMKVTVQVSGSGLARPGSSNDGTSGGDDAGAE